MVIHYTVMQFQIHVQNKTPVEFLKNGLKYPVMNP